VRRLADINGGHLRAHCVVQPDAGRENLVTKGVPRRTVNVILPKI
jgi:hypothetical protein